MYTQEKIKTHINQFVKYARESNWRSVETSKESIELKLIIDLTTKEYMQSARVWKDLLAKRVRTDSLIYDMWAVGTNLRHTEQEMLYPDMQERLEHSRN